MKKTKSIAVVALLVLAGTTNFNAKINENTYLHSHGGTIQAAGDYFVEMVKVDDKCTFYLLDANKNEISNKNITGNLFIKFSDNTSTTNDLSVIGNNGFLVVNDQLYTSTSCTITFKVNGKSVSTTFKYAVTPFKLQKSHGHSHGEGGHTH